MKLTLPTFAKAPPKKKSLCSFGFHDNRLSVCQTSVGLFAVYGVPLSWAKQQRKVQPKAPQARFCSLWRREQWRAAARQTEPLHPAGEGGGGGKYREYQAAGI